MLYEIQRASHGGRGRGGEKGWGTWGQQSTRKHPGRHTSTLMHNSRCLHQQNEGPSDQKTEPEVRKEIQAHPIWSHLKVVLRTAGHSPMATSPGYATLPGASTGSIIPVLCPPGLPAPQATSKWKCSNRGHFLSAEPDDPTAVLQGRHVPSKTYPES